jgi:hypothetical protein
VMSFESDESGKDIPAEVKSLIGRCVKSVGHLEALLLLHSQPDRSFTALELSQELRTNESYAAHQLTELCSVVERNQDRFKYKADAETDAAVSKLAEFARERRHALINYIYSNPASATRDSIRSFADAFKLKKD